jgi:hypothetical protein
VFLWAISLWREKREREREKEEIDAVNQVCVWEERERADREKRKKKESDRIETLHHRPLWNEDGG